MLGLFKKTAQSYSDNSHKNIRSAQQNIDIVRSEVYNVLWALLILMRTMLMIEGYEL